MEDEKKHNYQNKNDSNSNKTFIYPNSNQYQQSNNMNNSSINQYTYNESPSSMFLDKNSAAKVMAGVRSNPNINNKIPTEESNNILNLFNFNHFRVEICVN